MKRTKFPGLIFFGFGAAQRFRYSLQPQQCSVRLETAYPPLRKHWETRARVG